MLLLMLLVFLSAGIAQAQADISCIITPKSHSRMVFGKRMAEDMRIWTCVVHNEGEGPIVVSRASALRIMIDAGVSGYSEESVRIYYKENVRLGRPKTIGRIIQQIVRVGGIIIGSGIVPVGKTLQFITVVGGESLPGLGAAISGRAPTLENFERLAGSTDIGVPGRTDREFIMFSGRHDGPPRISGVIIGAPASSVSPLPMAPLPFGGITFEPFPKGMLEFESVPLPGDATFDTGTFPIDTGTFPNDDYFTLDPTSVPRALPRGFSVQRIGFSRTPTSVRPLAGVVELVIDSVTEDAIAQLERETITFERVSWPSPDHMSVYGSL